MIRNLGKIGDKESISKLVADRKNNARFIKMPPVSDRPLFPIKGITLTFLDFPAAILLPYAADECKKPGNLQRSPFQPDA
jgi:hypothetical protein